MSIEGMNQEIMDGLLPADRDALTEALEASDEAVEQAAEQVEAKPEEPTEKADTEESLGQADERQDNTFIPRYAVEAPLSAPEQASPEWLESQRATLKSRYENGEIGQDEYHAAREDILQAHTDAKHDYRIAQREAELVNKMNAQAAEQKWQWEQDAFFADESGPGKAIAANQLLYNEMNKKVIELAGKPENAGKGGLQILKEAGNQVMKMVEQWRAEAIGQATKQDTKQETKRVEAPPTLANIPMAAGSSTKQDEFAALDALDGLEYDAAFAKLQASNPEKARKYLHS